MGSYADRIEKDIKRSDRRISRIKQKIKGRNKRLSNLSDFIDKLQRMSGAEIKDEFGDADMTDIINRIKKNGYYRD